MPRKFTKNDQNFLTACGIAADEVDSTFSADRLALAERIAKHKAPAQVSVAPDAARLELVRLSVKKLLDASDEKSNRCRRPSGTFRAWFPTAEEAVAFAENPANTTYHGDVAVQCQKPGCGGWHLSQPHWPDAQAAINEQEN
jgi:hypothetical protein